MYHSTIGAKPFLYGGRAPFSSFTSKEAREALQRVVGDFKLTEVPPLTPEQRQKLEVAIEAAVKKINLQ